MRVSQQKLQKLQGENERVCQKSKLLGESPIRNYRNYRVKTNIPLELFDYPQINYKLHREKHTYIENLKPPSKNYRHYRVKMNAYIENLNPQGSLPVETTETTG